MGSAGTDAKWQILRSIGRISFSFLFAAFLVTAERGLKHDRSTASSVTEPASFGALSKALHFLWQPDESGYEHVWPEMEFGWRIIVGTIVGICGAAFGSVGGVGGGGIFVPMLSLIIGFDPKSSTAISKCMIMGASVSTVYYNLKLRHPTLDMPIIDYDLALLFQPMLMLGISIGVTFNVIFADWMVTVLLIVLFIGTSTKAFMRGIDTWNKETIMKKEATNKRLESNGSDQVEYKPLPGGPTKEVEESLDREGSILENVYWKECGLLSFVWIAFLFLQIIKNNASTCSLLYWAVNLLQIPVAVGVSMYEAVNLYKGKRIISSKGSASTNFTIAQLVLYCACGMLAGMVGGLLGLGGGFILGPLFLELGVPPQVSSATATFAMTFSSSMSVVEYYLLKRFPVPYALYFVAVATVAAVGGQHLVRRLIVFLGRTSLIIFILATTILISAISLGGVGVSNMIGKIHRHEYMGFDNLCKYDV